MPIKAVVFDLDGTLASFNIDYRTVRAEVKSLLTSEGIPPSLLSVKESIFEMLKKTEIFLRNNNKPQKIMEEISKKALAIAEKYELEAAKNTKLLPRVSETLKALKKMDLKIGLCTINGEKSVNYILQRFKIAEFFNAVIPRNKVKLVKPHAEHLEATLNALEVKRDEAIAVGDGTGDMRSAKELKVVAVGLPTGVSSPKELTGSGANYIITSIADLPTLIEQINETHEK
jgi:phosphoglycolate phosphatase